MLSCSLWGRTFWQNVCPPCGSRGGFRISSLQRTIPVLFLQPGQGPARLGSALRAGIPPAAGGKCPREQAGEPAQVWGPGSLLAPLDANPSSSPPHFHPRSHGALPALSGFAAAGGRDGLDFYCRDRLPSPEPIPAPGTRLQQHKQSFQAVKNPLQGHIYKTQYLQNGPVKLNCSSARANSPITAARS